jgi:hypothetical protein
MTCEFAFMGEDGPIGCLADVAVDVRWRWLVPHPEFRSEGSLCELHWMVACEQLADEPEVDQTSIEVRRRQ